MFFLCPRAREIGKHGGIYEVYIPPKGYVIEYNYGNYLYVLPMPCSEKQCSGEGVNVLLCE